MDLALEQREIDHIEFRLRHLKETIRKEADLLEEAEATLTRTQHAQEMLQHLAQAVQQQAHQKIAEVVSSCLSSVFDDPYEFHIRFERNRGRTEAHLRFVRNGLEVDPMTASGGGMVDVAAFALRVACLVLHRPKLNRLVFLDEPFRFVSAQYQENVRLMLEKLSEDLGLQIVMVTHNENLATGVLIEL
jgi:DNA repair exonuclease SbcCD ATPase subunit